MDNRPLTREEMRRVIEGKGNAHRIPMTFDFWRGAIPMDDTRYPYDLQSIYLNSPNP